LQFTKAFNWTPGQIDDTDLGILFEYIIVSEFTSNPEKKERVAYIDEVF
jgi:hypothetical protein